MVAVDSEDSLEAFKLAQTYAEKREIIKAVPILRKLLQSATPIRGAYLLYSKLILNISFDYLALEAARAEYKLFGCTEANDLALSLTQQALKKQESVGGLPLISFIAVAQAGEEADWRRCFESLSLQMHANVEVHLVSNSPDIKWGTLPAFVKRHAPQSSPLCVKTEISRMLKHVQGSIVSVIERSTTVFSDLGTALVAAAFSNDSAIKVLQSERVYAHETLVLELNRFSYPEWSQSLVLEPETLKPPSLMIAWKGLFFRKDILQELLPFDSRINHALAMDLVSKHLRMGQVFTIKVPTVLDDTPSEGRSYALTPLEVQDAQLIIEREKALLIGSPSREAPKFINPQPVGKLNQKMPQIQRSLLDFGRSRCPSISIVTAVFNCKDYLERCIDSILSQGYPNLEYIILDGGSTDGTQKIIEKYQNHLSFWRSAPDDGHYSALQEGFQRSSGTIMSWLNADDCLAPYSLDLVAAIFSRMEEVNWLTGTHCTMLANGALSVGEVPLLTGKKYYDDGFDRPFLQQEGTFWRRSLWNQSGASLNLQLDLAADMELWTRFFQREQPYVTSVPLGIFRVRPGQRSDIFRNRYYNQAYNVITRLKEDGVMPFNHPSPESTRLVIPVEGEMMER